MAVTRERFEQGLSYEQYKAQMTQNLERFEDTEQNVKFAPEDLDFFAKLQETINVAVITEDWCGDAMANVPVLGRLAQQADKLNVRLFLRDENLDLIDQYLKDGQYRSIPVFVFLDQDFRELGFFIERPASVTARRDEVLNAMFASNPVFAGVDPGTGPGDMPEEARNQLFAAFRTFRMENRDFMDSELVREFRQLIERGLTSSEG